MTSTINAQVNHVPLTLGGPAVENFLDEKGIYYYKFRIPANYNGKDDLVITIAPLDDRSDPDLHISSENEKPQNMQDSEYNCAMVGEDICTVPASNLKGGKTFYIGAKCYRKCHYKISAALLGEIKLEARKDYSVFVSPGDQKIFTFTNPFPGVENLIFTAKADRSTASMRMYLKEGAEGTPTTSDMKASDGWENGLVIKLGEKTMVKVKEDTTYKLLFESDDEINLTMRVDMLYSEKLIDEGVAYEDFVNYNDKTCYKYIVRNADKKLRIGAYAFSGNPDIYVNPESKPDELEDFAFIADEPSNDVLVLTPEDRAEKGPKKGIYYICVVGHSNTSYRMRVVESDQEYYLEDGIAETNEIDSGKETTFYYTDPALSRDLNLTFTLSVKSGPAPDMYIKFCGRLPEEQCIIGSKTEEGLVKANAQHSSLYAFIQHHGKGCDKNTTNQVNPCTYAIEISTPWSFWKTPTHFSLVAHHNETSHIKLREGISVEQIVENHEIRYFQFIVREDAATEVTFTLNSHHGDADIFVSKTDKYPSLESYDRKSDRSRRFADIVTFNKEEDNNLQGVYYIAVRGYEYSSYSIMATIVRGEDESIIVPAQITEGVALNDVINDLSSKKYYQFKTAMYGNEVSDLKVSVSQVEGQVKFYMKSGSFPSEDDYDYVSENGSDIVMSPDDNKFKPVGMKYVLVVPIIRYGQTEAIFRYSIKYTTAKSTSTLRKDTPSFGTVKVGQMNYYKYTSHEKGPDMTISLTPLSGDPNLIVSVNPNNTYPNLENYDYHSKREGRDSITLTGDKLFENNPSCAPSEKPALGAKPCEVYIAVYCSTPNNAPETRSEDSCSYSLKLYTDMDYPHMLIDGVPQKDSVKDKKYVYYYMSVNPGKDYLYISATADTGNVALYVNFGDQGQKAEELALPSDQTHVSQSKSVGHSQSIHFSKKQLKKECGEFQECIALIAVRGDFPTENNEYTLTSYTHLPRLISNSPMIGKVDEGSMIYFTYKSYCEDCSIIISASAYSVDADIDLYINVGHKKELPTKESHDIKSERWFSEVVELNLGNDYFTKNNIKSMKEVYIIGVYAKEETTISIEVEDTTSQIKQLRAGKGIQVDQGANEVRYFKYYHNEHKNLKYELTMLSGTVSMRINKYMDYENDAPEHKFLPTDDQSSLWSTNSRQNPTINISNDEEHFCSKCVYIIGITSHSAGAKFVFEIQKEDVLTSKQIRLGVPIKDQISGDTYKQYMFVLDKQKKFRISTSVYLGKVKFSVGKELNFDKPILESNSDTLDIDDSDLSEFQAGENVYIKVHGLYDHSEFILLATHHDSYSIVPDSFTQELTINPYEREGIHLLYYPPTLEFQLKMQVSSLSDGIAYDAFTKKQYIKDIQGDELVFPLKGEAEFGHAFWDKDKRYFNKIITQNPERDDEYVILVTLMPIVTDATALSSRNKVKLTVNMNAHEVNILSPNIPSEDKILSDNSQYRFFKFFANGNKDIDIILTPCVCDTDVYLFNHLNDAYDHRNPIRRTTHMINGQKNINIPDANGPYFAKVQLNNPNENNEYLKTTDSCVFTILFKDKDNMNYQYSLSQYIPGNNGLIDYSWDTRKDLKLTWGELLKETPLGTKNHPTIASLYLLKKPNLFMNSMCGIKHAVQRGEAELVEQGIKDTHIVVDTLKHSFIKKQKAVTFTLLAGVNREGGAVPYQPLRINVQQVWVYKVPIYVWFIFAIMCFPCVWLAWHYRKTARKVQSKLDYEMNDIRNIARVGYADDGVEQQNLKNSPGMMDESNV